MLSIVACPSYPSVDRSSAEGLLVREAEVAYGSSAADANDHGVVEAHTLLELIKSLHGTANQVRLRFIEALRTLHDERLCFELGYTSFHQFCDGELGISKSTAYEYLRVCTALERLPRLRSVFGEGELSWEQVRSITRVATSDTEVEWIELSWGASVRELLAEVKEAVRSGRTPPREKRHGLPNLLSRLSIELTLEEKERVRAAFACVAEALGTEDGQPADRGASPEADPRPTLLRWADAILAGAIPSGPCEVRRSGKGKSAGMPARPSPVQTILYQSCPDCRSATVQTESGSVQVAPARIDELAEHAKRVHIAPEEEIEVETLPPGELDPPNSARLASQVLHRDGLRCANPGCGSQRNLQAHHVVFRSKGGPTVLANEVAVCDQCHAGIHQGIVELRGSVSSGLEWCPRPRTPSARIREAEVLRDRLRELRDMRPPSVRRPDWSHQDRGRGAIVAPLSEVSTASDIDMNSARSTVEQLVAALACGLAKLGFPKSDAEQRVRKTVSAFVQRELPLTEGEILRYAISGKLPPSSKASRG